KIGIDPASNSVNVANPVQISNTPGSPEFVRNVDDGARQPFQAVAKVVIGDNATSGSAPFLFANNAQTVPAGDPPVLEQISARALLPSGYGAVADIETRVSNRAVPYFLVLNTQGFSPLGFDRVTTSQTSRIYADPGTPVMAVVNLDYGLAPGTGNVEVLTVSI